jgi:transposase
VIETAIDWTLIRRRLARYYSDTGRPSIPPEQLVKALLLGYLFGIPSERRLMQEIQVNCAYRWFLHLELTDPVWDHSTFSKNRHGRFAEAGLFAELFDAVVEQLLATGLVRGQHVSQDSTLVRANCSHKSFVPIEVAESAAAFRARVARENPVAEVAPDPAPPDDPGNPLITWRGETRSNATHRSTTDPDARYMRRAKGHESHPSYTVHLTMDNRTRVALAVATTQATDTEEAAGRQMLTHVRRRHHLRPRTVGADKGYAKRQYLRSLRRRQITPHVALPDRLPRSHRTLWRWMKRKTRSLGYRLSQSCRNRIEELVGEGKDGMGLSRMKLRGLAGAQEQGYLTGLALNLKRLVKLQTPCPAGTG